MHRKTNQPPLQHSALFGANRTGAEQQAAAGDFDFVCAATLLTDAAARAGAAIMAHYGANAVVEMKADNSPVTQADRDAEAILVTALTQLAPDIAIVSEEDAGDRGRQLARRFFLVDPLDGTKEFIQRRTDFTVNVALIENERPRFGLVYAPARRMLAVTTAADRAVEAELVPSAAGANLEELDCRRMQVRTAPSAGLTAVVSHSHLDPETEAFLGTIDVVKRSSAGSSLKFLLVARGEADVYPRFGPTMEWDIAAGQAILVAAGGEVVDADGRPLRYGKTATGLLNPSFIAWGNRH